MARTFNGSTDFVTAAAGNLNRAFGAFSVAGLFYHAADAYQCLIEHETQGTNGQFALEVEDVASGKRVSFDVTVGGTGTQRLGGNIDADGWWLVAVTKPTGTSTARYHHYKVATATWTHGDMLTAAGGAGTIPSPVASAATTVFGEYRFSGGVADFLNGDLEVVGVWEYELSDQQVESLLNWNSWLHPNLVGLWRFDQAATTTNVVDISGGGGDQTALTGTTVSTRGAPLLDAGGRPLGVQFAVDAPTVPGAPTSLTPTAGDTQVALAWTAPASDGGSAITDYIVQYRVTP